MRITHSKALVLAVIFLCVSASAAAQSVIHALTGTITSVDTGAKTMQVFLDNRTRGSFNDKTAPGAAGQVDKAIQALATPFDATAALKPYAIVFYVESPDGKSAVAVRDLGKGPFAVSKGLIVTVENKDTITVKDETEGEKSYKIDANTVAETSKGAVVGAKYQPHKGDKVRVVANQESGTAAALFVQVVSAN